MFLRMFSYVLHSPCLNPRAPPRSAESSVDQIGTKDSSKPDNESLASDSTIINESSQLPKPPSKPKVCTFNSQQ